MHLEMDGDVSGGDRNLYVEYMVNYQRDKRPFPTWSPFLPSPGEARRSGYPARPRAPAGPRAAAR
jgi:hypothetical protein